MGSGRKRKVLERFLTVEEATLGGETSGEGRREEESLGEAFLGVTKGGVGGEEGLNVTLCCSLSKSKKIFSTLLGSLNKGIKELDSPCLSFPTPLLLLFSNSFGGFSLELGVKTLFMAAIHLPFLPMGLALLFNPQKKGWMDEEQEREEQFLISLIFLSLTSYLQTKMLLKSVCELKKTTLDLCLVYEI